MGCVRMANSDVADLFSLVDAGTPVEIIPPTNPQPAIEHDDTPDTVFPHPTGGLTFNKQKQTLCVTNSSEPHYAAAVMAKAKNVNKGKRYTPQEKAQILEFVAEVNSKQKRGGQKAAAEKFGISPLTISNWLKAAGKKATKKPAAKKPAAEKPAAKKPATKKVAKKKAAKRGRPAKKKAGKPGRPAKKKAGKPGRPAKKKAAKRGRPAKKAGAKRGRPAGGGFITKLRKLANLNDEISKMETGIAKLKAEFATLKDSL